MHGCIDHLDSIVLFPSDYNELYDGEGREAEHALYALRNLIFNKTFLFIGTSLGDPQVKGIIEEIKRIQGLYGQKHYIIVSKPLENPLNSLAPIEVTSYTEISEVIKQLSEFKRAAEAKKSSQEKMLSDQLKESEKEIDSLTKKLSKVQNENERQQLLLEREAINHFYIGLKHYSAGEYLDALKEYKAATELKLKFPEAYYTWGNALSLLAQTKSDIEAEALYKESFEKYHHATQLKPDGHEAYNNWGLALSELAQAKSGIEAEALYKDSFEKYNYATQLKPDDHEAYNNWGVALTELAQIKSGSEAEKLYNEAFEKFLEAVKNGGSSYNLACLYAIRNKKEEALKYLERSLSRREASVEKVEKDKDWDGLRDDSDFKRILSNTKDSRQTIQENLLRSRKSGEVRIKVGRNDEFLLL